MRQGPAVVVLVALGATSPLAAQSLWLVPDGRRVVLLEILRPTFSGSALEFPSAAAYVTGRLALGERMALQVELPLAYANLTPVLLDLTETGLGSPYVGLVIRRPNSGLWGEVGARIPIATDNASAIVGLFADLDRLAAWSSDILPITGLAGYRWSYESGAFVAVRGGPGVWLDVGDAESEALFHGSIQAGYEATRVGIAGGVTSLTVISSDGGLGDRSLFQGGVVAEARFGALRPGVTLFVPIDEDMRDAIDLVFGIRLGVVLP